jgi:hypothetical protein
LLETGQFIEGKKSNSFEIKKGIDGQNEKMP